MWKKSGQQLVYLYVRMLNKFSNLTDVSDMFFQAFCFNSKMMIFQFFENVMWKMVRALARERSRALEMFSGWNHLCFWTFCILKTSPYLSKQLKYTQLETLQKYL